MEHYLNCWKRFADFQGRSRRKEYWTFTLINTAISLFFNLVSTILIETGGDSMGALTGGMVFSLLGVLFGLAVMIPSLAVVARRLHDTGRSAWNYLIVLIPLIGAILVLVWMFQDSQPGTNKWGPNPKGIEA